MIRPITQAQYPLASMSSFFHRFNLVSRAGDWTPTDGNTVLMWPETCLDSAFLTVILAATSFQGDRATTCVTAWQLSRLAVNKRFRVLPGDWEVAAWPPRVIRVIEAFHGFILTGLFKCDGHLC